MSQSNESTALPSLEQLASAPRFGLNARELILQAAAKLETVPQPRKAQVPKQGPSAASKPVRRLNPAGLVAAIHHANRPIVPFVARSSIARLQRQGCCDALLGQYYVILLEACKLSCAGNQAKAVEALKSADVIRTAAGAAATAHEQAVFMSSMSKHEYTAAASKAAATRQSLLQHAGPAMDAVLTQYKLTKETFLKPANTTDSVRTVGSKQPTAPGHNNSVILQQSQPAADSKDEDLFGEHDSDNEEDAKANAQPQNAGQAKAPDSGSTSVSHILGIAATAVPKQTLHSLGQIGSQIQHTEAEQQSTQQDCVSFPENQQATPTTLQVQKADQSHDVHALDCHPQHVNEDWDVDDGGREYSPEREDAQEYDQDVARRAMHPSSNSNRKKENLKDHEETSKRKRKQDDAHKSGANTQSKQPSLSSDAKRVKLGPRSDDSKAQNDEQSRRKQHADVSVEKVRKECSVSPSSDPQRPAVSAGSVTAAVADQVGEFVKGVLDPLYRAQLMDKLRYKEVVRKAVSKVMEHHKDATSASFLLKEHEQVRRYVMKLVEITATTQA